MRIKAFAVEDTQRAWQLSRVVVRDLTLFVGVSGVGKSKILRALRSLVVIAGGRNRPGYRWDIEFEDESQRLCRWQGEFGRVEKYVELPAQFDYELYAPDDESAVVRSPRVISERLTVDGRQIVDRDGERIEFNGIPLPKLDPHSSIVSLLKHEELIAPIHRGFQRIVFSDRTEIEGFQRVIALHDPERLVKRFGTIELVRQSSLAPLAKLFLAHRLGSDAFDDVQQKLRAVFPTIDSIGFGTYAKDEGPEFLAGSQFLELRERGVEQPIPQGDISSGMIRTILHLAEIFLSPSGTVILIDEFENSLGVNCIDAVTEDLLGSISNIQFLITSHHPYIINNVGASYWKVVSRQGSRVSAVDAADVGIGSSSHDAFLQLINSERYLRGAGGEAVSESLLPP